MENNDIRYIKSLVSKLNKRSDIEHLRISLYSILTSILLSKEIFKKNVDIIPFIDSLGLNYKEYVFKSRTLVVARVIRNVERAEYDDLINYVEVCKVIMFPNLNKKVDIPTRKSGSVDDLLNQFKRGE